jgi:hypothetical protein
MEKVALEQGFSKFFGFPRHIIWWTKNKPVGGSSSET